MYGLETMRLDEIHLNGWRYWESHMMMMIMMMLLHHRWVYRSLRAMEMISIISNHIQCIIRCCSHAARIVRSRFGT